MKVSVFRKEHFNAAHRLHNPKWDNQKNTDVFGKCNNPNRHGHNYEIIVKIDDELELSIKLFETERNFVEYPVG